MASRKDIAASQGTILAYRAARRADTIPKQILVVLDVDCLAWGAKMIKRLNAEH
jgi:hypothetical protein